MLKFRQLTFYTLEEYQKSEKDEAVQHFPEVNCLIVFFMHR